MNYNRGYCSLRAQREQTSVREGTSGRAGAGANGENGRSLAMVYCPEQKWGGIIPPCEALKTGTVFKGLDLPFAGGCRGRSVML